MSYLVLLLLALAAHSTNCRDCAHCLAEVKKVCEIQDSPPCGHMITMGICDELRLGDIACVEIWHGATRKLIDDGKADALKISGVKRVCEIQDSPPCTKMITMGICDKLKLGDVACL
uniref:Uncharacterized protein n=1 Tax=Ditylenchus dipsaci TaxID=166011 RepID=A0A915D179_9BILA